MQRRYNPYVAGTIQTSVDAWNEGYEAAEFNADIEKEDDDEGGDTSSPYRHACDDCTHRVKEQYNLKVMFTIEDIAGNRSLSATQLAEQLAEALPKEWWQDSNMADWGTVAIYPLDNNGDIFPF
jgi:hypothetical protein